jgi:hypothetical protein
MTALQMVRQKEILPVTALLRKIATAGIAFIWMASTTKLLRGADPHWADYAVQAVFHGHSAAPRFKPGADTWPDADPRFRDSVKFELGKGANFAGFYTIVKVTCGTGCCYVVVVDVRSGHIYENLPFRTVVVGGPHPYRGLVFRLDSRLLMVEGSVDGSRVPSRTYYEWVGTSLHLIQKTPVAVR